MLRRKIEDTLEQWKKTSGHKPLVIMGIRQCGKTFIVQHFAAAHYKECNPKRYESNLDKTYDSKNMMHCFRLMHMASEIAEGKGVILQCTWD